MEDLLTWAVGRSIPEWLIFIIFVAYIFRDPLRGSFSKLFGFVEKKEADAVAERVDQREHAQRAEVERLQANLKQQTWFDEQLMEMLLRSQAHLQDDVNGKLDVILVELKEQKHRMMRNNDMLTALNMLVSETVDWQRGHHSRPEDTRFIHTNKKEGESS